MISKKPVANSKKVAVTFEMPAAVAAESLNVVGDFNSWDANATPMKRQKAGDWSTTLRLAPGNYRFRYLADGTKWENDMAPDGFEPSGLGSENCVLIVGNGNS
jgi:1,4-alpha-glucan branching enzyme